MVSLGDQPVDGSAGSFARRSGGDPPRQRPDAHDRDRHHANPASDPQSANTQRQPRFDRRIDEGCQQDRKRDA